MNLVTTTHNNSNLDQLQQVDITPPPPPIPISTYKSNKNHSNSNIEAQNNLLLDKLLNFYRRDNNISYLQSIIDGSLGISLRVIDWFVTNYAKKNIVCYKLNTGKKFDVYDSYKSQLKSYNKKRFDPFHRWYKVEIPISEDDPEHGIVTTIGQLNFFKWAIENNIINYIMNNIQTIENDMNRNNSLSKSKNKKSSKNVTRKVRQELSVNASKYIRKEKAVVVISFN